MSRKKSVVITSIIMILLAALLITITLLCPQSIEIVLSIFAIPGFAAVSYLLNCWIYKSDEIYVEPEYED